MVVAIESAKRVAEHLLKRRGYARTTTTDIAEPGFLAAYSRVRPYTMTSIERLYGLYTAVQYIVDTGVQGDVVECGVWRGGSSMLAAMTLRQLGDERRTLWLYDTFAGMAAPAQQDGEGAAAAWAASEREHHNDWCYAPVDDVRANMATTNYPEHLVRYVQGKVEETLPSATTPPDIALLRLDTDWYESTRHELDQLYPRLRPGGVLIIDDYGHWQGARRAVDEYFAENGRRPLLSRLDYTGRIGIKPS